MFWKDKQFTHSLIGLAIPVALQNLISAVLNIFDQVMVGLLPSDIADKCLSAVVVINQVVMIYSIILFAASNTVNIFIAQYTDTINQKLIPQRVGIALTIGVGAGVVFTVIGVFFSGFVVGLFDADIAYRAFAEQFLSVVAWSFVPMAVSVTIGIVLRAIKRMRVVLVANVLGVVANIIFNYVLMFGLGDIIPAYGFIGAAYGTIIARVLEAMVIVLALIWKKYPIFAKPSVMFRRDKPFNKLFVVMFFPILLNELTWAVSNAVFLFIFDKQPNAEVVLAAFNITSTVDKLISVALMGVCASACVIMGNIIAGKDKEQINKYAKFCTQFAIVVGIIVTAIMMISAFVAPLGFANASIEAKEMATNMIAIYAVACVPRALAFMLIVGVLRSGGDTIFCMLAESAVIWLFAIPFVCVAGLVFQWNIYILLGIVMFAELLKSILCVIRLRKGKWIKLVT